MFIRGAWVRLSRIAVALLLAALTSPRAAAGSVRSGPESPAAAGTPSVAKISPAPQAGSVPGAVPAVDPLAADRLDPSPAMLERVRATETMLVDAVRSAMAGVLGEDRTVVVSRGSTARATFVEEKPDYDINVRLPDSWTPQRFEEFRRDGARDFHQRLDAALQALVRKLPGHLPGVTVVGQPIWLNDIGERSHPRFDNTMMIPVTIKNAAGGDIVEADVTLTINDQVANGYPEYFSAQLEGVKRLGGQAAADQVLSDIRLAKLFFKRAVGAYRPWRGGPGGVGIEQMVMQSGKVEASDSGRTILEPGSFSRLMGRIVRAGFDQTGQLLTRDRAAANWKAINPFTMPANFVELLWNRHWDRLAQLARLYTEAERDGRKLSIAELARQGSFKSSRAPRVSPPTPALPEVALRPATAVLVPLSSSLGRRATQAKVAGLVKELARRGVAVASAETRRAGSEARSYEVRLQLEPGQDPAAAVRALAEAASRLGRAVALDARGSKVQSQGDDLSRFDVVLLARAGRSSDGRPLGVKSRNKQRFVGSLLRMAPDAVAAAEIVDLGMSGKNIVVGLTLAEGASAEQTAALLARAALARGAHFVVAGAAYPKRPVVPAAAPVAGASAAAAPQAGPLGALTLKLLDRFITFGPKPADRGDAFLYAQGAKALPEPLEAALRADNRSEKPAGEHATIGVLLRRGGKTFLKLEGAEDDLDVAWTTVEGIPSDTLVELRPDGSARPLGGRRVEMMIGRVEKRGNGLVLKALLSERGQPKALYKPLPIVGGEGARPGTILQAVVTGKPGRFQATPLLDLGSKLTQEIIAREIEFRRGARGYFPADVIRQAESGAEGAAVASPGGAEDLRAFPFVTVDPYAAGDLDDAFYVRRDADGGYTWYLATADVSSYVPPGSPAFREAASRGSTSYSIDKDGVSDFPMNHPVVAKYKASLLAGKDSRAKITRMKFDKGGNLLLSQSGVSLGVVRVQGRYTYDQVSKLWRGEEGHGVTHGEMIGLARELAAKLAEADERRGKLALDFDEVERVKENGEWRSVVTRDAPIVKESHRLIEELKIYGNMVITARLEQIQRETGVPHIQRSHPPASQEKDRRARQELEALGVPWPSEQTLPEYLAALHARQDVPHRVKQLAQMSALRTRERAVYVLKDLVGHQGLALAPGQYDHPSAPIRRFSDMYDGAILQAALEGRDPRAVYQTVMNDLRALGFSRFEDFLKHLNARQQAEREIEFETEYVMTLDELSQPRNLGRSLPGYVKMVKPGRDGRPPRAVIQLEQPPVEVTIAGEKAAALSLLQDVDVVVRAADPASGLLDADVRGR